MTVPLSLGERARVRGNNARGFLALRTIPGIVERRESSGKAAAFPTQLIPVFISTGSGSYH